MKRKSIGFIGGGRITRIFLQGFKNSTIEFQSIVVCDTNQETLDKLIQQFPKIHITDSCEVIAKQNVVFIALHPPVIGKTLLQLKGIINQNTLFISLAPKFTLQRLSELLGTQRIIRMIPNAASYSNIGYNPICFSDEIEKPEKESILEVLSVLGKNIETEETKLEAYAIASAMLPTYFWFQWKEMEQISQEMGLTEDESRETLYESLKASIELMYNSQLSYDELSDLIPVKPIGENEPEIKVILQSKLLGLFKKIKV